MNDKFNLRHIPRNNGKTYLVAKAVKEHSGVLVCANTDHANQVAKEYGIQTVTINNLKSLVGGHPKLAFDTHAVEVMSSLYEQDILKQEGEINGLKRAKRDLHDELASCDRALMRCSDGRDMVIEENILLRDQLHNIHMYASVAKVDPKVLKTMCEKYMESKDA